MSRRDENGSRQRIEAFQIPLLIELATRVGFASSRHFRGEPSVDLEGIRDALYSFYKLSPTQRSVMLKSGRQPQVYQEVHRARHLLVVEGEMERSVWSTTDRGRARLRTWTAHLLLFASDASLNEIMASPVHNDGDLFVNVMRQVKPSDLEKAVNTAQTQRELFVCCLRALPLPFVGPMLYTSQRSVRQLAEQSLNSQYASAFARLVRNSRGQSRGVLV